MDKADVKLEEKLQRLTKKFRFAATRPDGRSSDPWVAWTKKRDFYLAPERIGGCIKVSCHAQGGFRLAFTKEYAEHLKGQGNPLKNRAIITWPKPNPVAGGAIHVLSVLLPVDYFTSPVPSDGKTRALFEVRDPAKAAEIGAFYSPAFSATLESNLQRIGMPLVWLELDDGSGFSLVARAAAFDPSILPRAPVPSAGIKVLDPPEMPAVGETWSGLKALLFTDAAKHGTLHVIEVGGISLQHNGRS
jgi:hypothetical protein